MPSRLDDNGRHAIIDWTHSPTCDPRADQL